MAYTQVEGDADELPNALEAISTIVTKFRDDVLELGYDGGNCTIMGEDGGPGYKWSFPGSLLFAVTVITTIGNVYLFPFFFYLSDNAFIERVVTHSY